MQNAAYYRARAREQLGGNIFANNWLLALVCYFLVTLVLSLASSFVGSIATFLLEGFCYFGLAHIFLSVARGRKNAFEIKDLLAGKDRIGELLILSLMKNLFLFLWGFVPVVGFIKSYSYSMTYFIKYDHPGYDWKTAITESRRMMDGHKWQLFCLELSFFGWMLVGWLCFGIGTFWVFPYLYLAEVNFYEDLKKEYDSRVIVE